VIAGLATIINKMRFAPEFRRPRILQQPGNGQNTGTETIRHVDSFLLSATPTLLSFEA